ncbi:hypothetical protein MNBD_CHLOROFLEXI01-1461 [hydrothermal vent metagenome]|uniref:Cytochrome b561 bacterial/Ni-hydrogenase domain-containing protein n=1 Tax=hydrothermal vent metagenome TaxID=652676 RepID=A0A3B0VG61_9ZZZZ
MTTSISSNGSESQNRQQSLTAVSSEEAAVIERIKRRAQARKLRAAQKLAAQVQIGSDGTKTFIRFSSRQRLEHQVLLITFSTLALTGMLQHYSAMSPVAWVINTVFGGVETLRTLHHLAALIFILEAIYHLGIILTVWFVHREKGGMWPRWRDLTDIIQMMKYNAGLAGERPLFDRFSAEEKIEYWALLWGSVIMIVTGLIQWFPTWVTMALPGQIIPVSRAIHGWEAILATLSILIWHMYHTIVKEKNKSIFNGLMSEQEMEENHPLEYRRIMAATNYLQQIVAEQEAQAPVGKKEETTVTMDGEHELA